MKSLTPYLVILIPILTFFCSGTRPPLVGNNTKDLSPCPGTPNCVSTFATDSTHGIEPFHFSDSDTSIIQILEDIVKSLPRTKVIKKNETYLYAEFTSRVWRFVDDVEFIVDRQNNQVDFRSSSRLGRSDLGVNRERMEEIRKRFLKSTMRNQKM